MNQKVRFRTEAPLIKYHQKIYNSCCLSSLASAFHFIGDDRVVTSVVNCIEESLTLQTEKFKDIIHLANAIMTYMREIKGEHCLCVLSPKGTKKRAHTFIILFFNNSFF